MNMQSHDHGDEEKERLMKVVEYLEPLMSKELLSKFPDNSAFDFDYSQSTIWSPLVPRSYNPMDLDLGFITPIKLSSTDDLFDDSDMTAMDMEFEEETVIITQKNNSNSRKKVTSNIKKKTVVTNAFNFNFNLSALRSNMKAMKRKKNKNKNKKMVSDDFSPTPLKGGCYPNPNNGKGWRKLLRAATKHFKKKKKDSISTSHMKMKLYF